MTTPPPPLSVRLEPKLAQALERHCAQTGESRSRVVQQSLAQYLMSQSGPTLGTLAEAVLPPLPKPERAGISRAPRQKRYQDYVREKRRR